MKRAKIMLSVLGVLAVVACALAFKASRTYSGNFRCDSVPLANTTTVPMVSCPTTDRYVESDHQAARIRFCTEATAPANAPCFATARWLFVP
jgi:hypothetical protein